ncbi:ATP-grasp domain-containing protein [Methylomonas sp. AM2-LC]|uniref:ATP-grasp domain-containing protein n=1 Tax=Methylomonas sp. AM2-LC TaxID=3153301 RepID=UPI003264CDF7
MFWRLHKAIFKNRIDEARQILVEFGDQVQIVSDSALFESSITDISGQPALALTTIQDARRISGCFAGNTPWLYFNEKDYAVSRWMPSLIQNVPILNWDGIWVPYGMLKNLSRSVVSSISSSDGEVFIKPDKGHKSFAGFTVSNKDFFNEIEETLAPINLYPEVMCFLAPGKVLKKFECRFWIVNRRVVCHSYYSWNEAVIEWMPATDKMKSIAQAVANNVWQPDIAYTADVVETKNGDVFLCEINAASTSGVYTAPLKSLLYSLRNAAHSEFNGELTL